MDLKKATTGEKPLLETRVSQEITALELQRLSIEQRLSWLREYENILEKKGMLAIHG